MAMKGDAYLKCIDPNCGCEYDIESTNVQCEKGHLLDVKYKNKPTEKLKEISIKEEIPKEVSLMKVEFGDLENY